MIPIFKKENVVCLIASCSECGDTLTTLPDHEYQCSCGVWEPTWNLKADEIKQNTED